MKSRDEVQVTAKIDQSVSDKQTAENMSCFRTVNQLCLFIQQEEMHHRCMFVCFALSHAYFALLGLKPPHRLVWHT